MQQQINNFICNVRKFRAISAKMHIALAIQLHIERCLFVADWIAVAWL